MSTDSDAEAMRFLLEGIESEQLDANRAHALRARHIAEAIVAARRRPHVYTTADGDTAAAIAESAVVFELALRLQLSEPAVRSLARTADDASRWLPELWRRAEEGYAALALVDAALAAVYRLTPAPDATPEQAAAARAAIRELDAAAAEWSLTCTDAAFRARVRRRADRLDARAAEVRHAVALADRRVVVESADDGMAWISAFVSMTDALAIKRRLTSTAKHLAKDRAETRSRDQLRADLLAAWLRGTGTPTAVTTKVFVTVPVGVLAGTAADEHGRCTACGGTGRPEQPLLVGHGPIDPLTAKQLFLDAKAFHRVVTDPVRGVVVDLDRRTYRATTSQRDWLVLQHGTCSRDGCTRLALDADIDHEREWSRGGKTDLANERPFCPPDHVRRHRTRFRYRSRPDGTVQVTTPTGFATTPPPPF